MSSKFKVILIIVDYGSEVPLVPITEGDLINLFQEKSMGDRLLTKTRIVEVSVEKIEKKPEGLDLSSIPAELKEPYAILISAKYATHCIECAEEVKINDKCYWNKRTSEVFCESCGKELS